MANFVIEQSFWDLFPQCEIGVLVVKGIDNTEGGCEDVRPSIIEYLEKSNEDAKKYLTEDVFSQNKVIAVWREAFQKFKTKKGVRCSIEALLKRIEKGNQVSVINPLVDIYNSISLKFGLPCGAEDIDTFKGDLRLTVTEGDDLFLALGDQEYDYTLHGEVCYLDGEGAVCRCWNWRDGQRTMLTENTNHAFIVIESVDPHRSADLRTAMETLAERVPQWLGGEVTALQILNVDSRELSLD